MPKVESSYNVIGLVSPEIYQHHTRGHHDVEKPEIMYNWHALGMPATLTS